LYYERSHSTSNGELRVHANYRTKLSLLAGIAIHSKNDKFLQGYGTFQIGYWRSSHWEAVVGFNPTYTETNSNSIINQLAVGPLMGLRIGKRRFKGNLEFEELLFPTKDLRYYRFNRLTRISLGFHWIFIKERTSPAVE